MANNVDMTSFTRRLDAVLQTYQRLPTEIATIAVNFTKERFREQAWLDRTKHNWVPRKNIRGRSGRRSQTLLVNKGRLKRSIRKIKATPDEVIIGTDVEYAEIHNEGGRIDGTVNVKAHTIKSHRRKAHTRTRAGRTEKIKSQTVRSFTIKAHTRKMNTKIPSRRFIGESFTLIRRIELHTIARFRKALR